MIKLVGFIIILLSSAKIGFDISAKYTGRVEDLKSFISALGKIKTEISFSNCEITDALITASNVKSVNIHNILLYIANKIEKGKMTLCDAFSSYIGENETFLIKEDIEEIRRFFSVFGSGDREDELENVSNTIINLKLNLNNAVENAKKYVKLYRTSGILAGFLIAIILA